MDATERRGSISGEVFEHGFEQFAECLIGIEQMLVEGEAEIARGIDVKLEGLLIDQRTGVVAGSDALDALLLGSPFRSEQCQFSSCNRELSRVTLLEHKTVSVGRLIE